MKIERVPSGSSTFQMQLQLHHTCFRIKEGGDIFEYAFEILNREEAILHSTSHYYLTDVIEEFLFYSGFISCIKDLKGNVLYEIAPKKQFKVPLSVIQPSQLYVSQGKMNELSSWIESDEDIIIPVTQLHGEWVSLDGHTRLKLAQQLGFESVYIYEEEPDHYIEDFVRFCKENQKESIFDLPIISVEEYDMKWNQFCEQYFNGVS